MAASVFSLEAVRDFIIQNNFKVTNHELVTRFKSFLNDPVSKNQNREKFKDYVNTLATIKVDERGEKLLVLKKKYRSDEGESQQRQDRARSEPPTQQDSRADNSDGDGLSKGHSDNNISRDGGPDTSSVKDSNSVGTLSVSSVNSSTTSQNSLQSQPSSNDDEANASIVSVRERAQHLNRMESESEMRGAQSPIKKDSRVHTKEKTGELDDDSHSSGSGYVTLDPEEKEWLVICASAEYHPMHKMLTKNAQLARLKDFTNYTALHWAAKHGKPEVVKLVASKIGVDVNKRTNGGYTPLHLAAMQGHEEIIELLVQTYKADPNMRDYSGKKAKQYLRNTASTKAQQLLLSRKLGATIGSVRSLDDSFTRSSSFRRSKQVKAISSLIHGGSSGVRAMFRTTWAGSADDLMRPGNTHTFPRLSQSRSPSVTPPGSTEASPVIPRKSKLSEHEKELMPPPVAPLRRNKKDHNSRKQDPSPEEMQRSISETALSSSKKTYI